MNRRGRGRGGTAGREVPPVGRGEAAGQHSAAGVVLLGAGGRGRGRGREGATPAGREAAGRQPLPQQHNEVALRAIGGRGRGRGRGGRAPVAGQEIAGRGQPLPHEEWDEDRMLKTGLKFVGFEERRQRNVRTNMRRFREHFGVGPKACACLFNDLWQHRATLASVDHQHPWTINVRDFLMAANWWKTYDLEGQLAARWRRDEKTIREKTRAYSLWASTLKGIKIVFGNFEEDDVIFISVDGVHCKISEPRKRPSAQWYSHKSNSAGLTYELAIAIRSDRLVWIRGPFPASQHDITTFRGGKKTEPKDQSALFFQIPEGKKAVGDSGYKGEPTKVTVSRAEDSQAVNNYKARAKARQESFHSRLKAFKILSTPFRHRLNVDTLEEHKRVFEAVCVACQYDLENGHPLFDM